MNGQELIHVVFHAFLIIAIFLGGWAIFWKWRYEKHYERCVTDDEACLLVRCVPGDLRKIGARIVLLYIMPMMWAFLLLAILIHPDSRYWLPLFLSWIVSAELLVMIIQTITLGQTMQIGPKGICYPVSGFCAGIFKTKNRDYSKLSSMEFAVNPKKTVIAPSRSILAWQWTEYDDRLTLTLNCRGILKPKPKTLSFIFPRLSEPELREMLAMFEVMNRELEPRKNN